MEAIIRRYVTGPVARLIGLIPYEPVRVLGSGIIVLTFLRDQLDNGADLETALTAAIIFFGTQVVRQNVWPSVKVDAAGAKVEPLEAPVTGLEDADYVDYQ
jgi:hypothetical protein